MVTVVADPADAQDKVPEPLVDRTVPAEPSADGRVHVTFVATVAGAWNATQLEESESAKRRSACALRVTSPVKAPPAFGIKVVLIAD